MDRKERQRARRKRQRQDESRKAWNAKHRLERNAYHRVLREKVKEAVFDHYGRACVCCGETHKEFLTIDHINGGGHKHRREIRMEGSRFYTWLIRNDFPIEFRVLCYNCNCSIGRVGYCPHQAGLA